MKVIKRLAQWLLTLAAIALIVGLVMYRGIVYDGVTALRYQPSPELAAVVDNTQLTWLGRVYFYGSEPVFDHSNQASKACGGVEKNSAILGCYADQTIYVYDVDNSDLNGVEEVTTAHEMLHVAYGRLPERQRTTVDQLLKQQEKRLEGNRVFTERMAAYSDISEADRLNELHSIIATEVPSISSELEDYYDQYFSDRTHIVSLYQDYSSVFFTLEKELEQDIARYNRQTTERNQLVQSMNDRQAQLERQIATINRRSSVTASEAAQINAQIDQYNRDLAIVRAQVTRYDQELEQLRQTIESSAAMQEELNQAIDSSLAPAPQL